MFGFRRPSPEIEAPKGDAELLRSRCRRQSYLQRLGVRTPMAADCSADPAELNDCKSMTELPHGKSLDSLETLSTASGDTWSTASTESDIISPVEAHDEIRQRYLRKLAYNKVWVPQVHRPAKHQTIVIFDWDDTLLCTTWLRQNDFHRGGDHKNEERLQAIVRHSKNLLETAIKAGHTYIITNAQSGWVERSAARWAPELLPVLRKVQVISARDRFEASFPGDARQWKMSAFLELQRKFDTAPITNLVALGDSNHEIEAARVMGAEFEEGLVKTVKFRSGPDPEELLMQLELVESNLERVIGSVKDLAVCLERGE